METSEMRRTCLFSDLDSTRMNHADTRMSAATNAGQTSTDQTEGPQSAPHNE